MICLSRAGTRTYACFKRALNPLPILTATGQSSLITGSQQIAQSSIGYETLITFTMVMSSLWNQRVDSCDRSIVHMSDTTLCLSQSDAVATA